LVVVEGVSNLIHDEVRVPEETMDSIVQINADIVFVFLEAEVAEEEVFEPMVIELHCYCSLRLIKHTRS